MIRYLLLPVILTLSGIFFTGQTSAQGFMLTGIQSNPSSVMECDSLASISIAALTQPQTSADFNLALLGSSFQSSQFTVMVNWGDGATTNHNGGTSTAGSPISFTPFMGHYYNNPGTYTIYIEVTNPQNGSWAADTLYYTKTICNAYLFSNVVLDCDGDGNADSTITNGVPIMLNGPMGSYSGILNGGSVTFMNLVQGNYNVSVDQAWLNQNNYVVNSVTPFLLNISPNMQTFTSQIILNCDSIPPTPANNLCLSGVMYCDADNSGTYTAGDSPIANAPVQLTNGGFSTVVYTNPNGYYSISYQGIWNTPSIVTVSNAWLQQNGYTMTSNPYTILADSCATQPTYNIPVNCGGNPCSYQCVSVVVFCDANSNGVYDNGESPLAFAPVTLWTQNQNQTVIIYTDSNGYALYCGNGLPQQAVVAQISPSWLTQHGYTIANPYLTILTSPNQTPNPGYFAVNCGGGQNNCADLWTTVTPWIGYYQNSTAYIKLSYGNYGPGAPGNYTVTLTFPAGVTVNTSSIANPNYTISGNTITWTLNSAATSFSYYDYITFSVPMGIPNGTPHYFVSTIAPSGNVSDCCQNNNSGTLLQIVGNSYDPNDKNVDTEEQMDPSIENELTFTVRFQNTGTAPAQNIYVLDTISPLLDLTTFEVLESSHPMHVDNLGAGVLRFNFPQIWLPDSTSNEPESHGHFVYRIKETAGNPEGTEIFNTAYIYFDWNEAVVTNTTYNVNTSLGLNESAIISSIYPNPFTQLLTVRSNSELQLLTVMDLSGKTVLNSTGTGNQTTLDLGTCPAGVYLIRVQTESGVETARIVKK